MFDRILVPLDGSRFAESALPAAIALAGKRGGEVHLVRVLERLAADVLPLITPPDREGARKYLCALAEASSVAAGARVSVSVREGVPVDEIAAAAREWGADLVVMCTHGRGGVSRLWLGSVADRFLRSAELPIFLMRPPERLAGPHLPFSISRVVAPLDGSERAESALPWATSLARAFDVPLLLVQAIVYPGAPELERPGDAEIVVAAERAARAYLDEVCHRLNADGVRATNRVIRGASASQLALETADGNPVVMTTRGRGPLSRALLGSVTDKTVRAAVGPVLVIPPRVAEETAAAT